MGLGHWNRSSRPPRTGAGRTMEQVDESGSNPTVEEDLPSPTPDLARLLTYLIRRFVGKFDWIYRRRFSAEQFYLFI